MCKIKSANAFRNLQIICNGRSENQTELQTLLFLFSLSFWESRHSSRGLLLVKDRLVCDPLSPVSREV